MRSAPVYGGGGPGRGHQHEAGDGVVAVLHPVDQDFQAVHAARRTHRRARRPSCPPRPHGPRRRSTPPHARSRCGRFSASHCRHCGCACGWLETVAMSASVVPGPHQQRETDRQQHLAPDLQRAAGRQLVQRARYRALDRILERDQRRRAASPLRTASSAAMTVGSGRSFTPGSLRLRRRAQGSLGEGARRAEVGEQHACRALGTQRRLR